MMVVSLKRDMGDSIGVSDLSVAFTCSNIGMGWDSDSMLGLRFRPDRVSAEATEETD